MGKLGARELNLSSDVDLIYLHASSGSPDSTRSGGAAGRMVYRNSVGAMLSNRFAASARAAGPRRWSRRLKARSTTTRTSASRGSAPRCCGRGRSRATSKSATELRAELNHFVFRSYLDFDTLRQLRAMKHQIEAELKSARDDRAQHQARPRRNPRTRIHRAGAHADLRRTRSAASNRADRRRAREARHARLPAVEARARTRRRLPVPARRRAQAASRGGPADARAARPITTGCARWRRGWVSARARGRWSNSARGSKLIGRWSSCNSARRSPAATK